MNNQDIFSKCQEINKLLFKCDENKARENLIKLLDYLKKNNLEQDSFVNHLLRQTGLYPYMNINNSLWQDRLVCEVFKIDTRNDDKNVLHREQSRLLKKLLEGSDVAVSAPTSFGKSFVIDAFLQMKKPKNIMIIVPTIALMDETRRRISKKFSDDYQVITTIDIPLQDNNIFIFPQERALSYVNQITSLDLLVIDEFYKASSEANDKERGGLLLRVITEFSGKAKQKYFLAPNIKKLIPTDVMQGVEFLHLDFHTVFLEKIEKFKLSEKHKKDEKEKIKNNELLSILKENISKKNIIYAGTYSNIKNISEILLSENLECYDCELTLNFSQWLSNNYGSDYILSQLVRKNIGIHNGKMHRCLSQIQVYLFQEKNIINHLITTSSIMEGVNTSAENIILWSQKNGQSNLNNFEYKNLIGRAGRMFKYFVGKIYLLEEPPKEQEEQITIEFPQDFLFLENDMGKYEKKDYTDLIKFKEEVTDDLNIPFDDLIKKNIIQNQDKKLIQEIIKSIKAENFSAILHLNSSDSTKWRSILYKIIKLKGGAFGKHQRFLDFVIDLNCNLDLTLPQLIKKLNISAEDFFDLEKNICHNLAPLCSDINEIYKLINKGKSSSNIDSFVGKISHAFLPKNIYLLEEYGLPRMISKIINQQKIIDLSNNQTPLNEIISLFNYKKEEILNLYKANDFESFILQYFYDGIEIKNTTYSRE